MTRSAAMPAEAALAHHTDDDAPTLPPPPRKSLYIESALRRGSAHAPSSEGAVADAPPASNGAALVKAAAGAAGTHDVRNALDAHWIDWPGPWELRELHSSRAASKRVRPFHPTRITAYDPASQAFHSWQSRANRKHTRHHPGARPRAARPWWRYLVCWKPGLFAWWNAAAFTVGSVFFIIVGAVLLVPSYAEDAGISLAMGKLGLAGAVLFAVGGTAQVLEVLQAPVEISDASWATRVQESYVKKKHGGGGSGASPLPDASTQPPSRTPSEEHAAQSYATRILRKSRPRDADGRAAADSAAGGRHAPSDPGKQRPRPELPVTVGDVALQAIHATGKSSSADVSSGGGGSGGGGHKPPPQAKRPRNGFDLIADSDLPLYQRLYVVFGQWKRIDVTLAWIQWVGTLLFIVNSVGTVGWWMRTMSPDDPGLFLGVTIVPDITASCTFVIAGWLQLVEATHCWWGGLQPRNLGYWVGINNTLGGLGFLGNAVLWYRIQSKFATTLVLLIGSVFFFNGSFLTWIEQCIE